MSIEDGNLGTVDTNGQPIGGAGGGDNYGQTNDLGLNDADAAAWQAMQNGDPLPADQQQPPPVPPQDGPPPLPVEGDNSAYDQTLDQLFGREPREPVVPPVDQSKAPAPAAGDDEDLPPLNPTQQTVAYGKYRRDLEKLHDKLKTTKAQLASGGTAQTELTNLKAEHNKMLGRFELLMDAVNKGTQKAPEAPKDPALDDPMPDPEEKPFEAISWLVRDSKRLRDELKSARGETKKVQDAHVADLTERDVASHYVADAQRFAGTEPAFGMAYMHLKSSRLQEMCMARFFQPLYGEGGKIAVSEEQLAQLNNLFQDEERSIASSAIKQGKSPAEFIWTMAQFRGFDPVAARERIKQHLAGGQQQKVPAGGKVPAPAPAKPTPSEVVKSVREGLEASRSLSDGGSAPNHGRLSVKQVAEMDEDAFGELYEALGGKNGVNREILGGPSI